jgi:16S rRNA (cytidine1402-2'-O)-methyltransferase
VLGAGGGNWTAKTSAACASGSASAAAGGAGMAAGAGLGATGAGTALVFAWLGAHNPPGALQNGVLQALTSAATMLNCHHFTLFILPP